MSVPKMYLDGTMAYGSRTITTTTGAVTYIASNIKVDRPTTEAIDEHADGTPGRRRETAGVATLTAELQLATSSTAYPVFGDTFTTTLDSNYGSETWVISPVPHEEDNKPGSIRVVNITAKKVINSITLVS